MWDVLTTVLGPVPIPRGQIPRIFPKKSARSGLVMVISWVSSGSMWASYSPGLPNWHRSKRFHYDDVIMTMLASQITSLTVVYSIVYSGVNQRKHQSSASLAFVREIHRGPVNFPHKWPVTRKMFPFDDVIMFTMPEKWDWRICIELTDIPPKQKCCEPCTAVLI